MNRGPDAKLLGVFETNHNLNVAVSIIEALMFDVLFNGSVPDTSFYEVGAQIVIDESYTGS